VPPTPVHPAEGDARPCGCPSVGADVVPHEERLRRCEAQRVQGDAQDAGIGLGETTALRGDHYLEETFQPGRPQPRSLDAINAIGHDPQPVKGPEAGQGGPAAGQAVTTLGQVFEVGPAEANRPPAVRPQEVEQTPEAFHRQYRLGDSSLAVEGPEFVVDATVLAQGGGAQGQAQPGEGGPECGPLGAVEVEQGVVEVEENGAETRQGGYLAR
jgi:hypothetical protein